MRTRYRNGDIGYEFECWMTYNQFRFGYTGSERVGLKLVGTIFKQLYRTRWKCRGLKF